MQSLPVVPRLMPAILAGTKTHTIRWREAPIRPGPMRPGPMRYVEQASPAREAVVEVIRVTDMPLRDAAGFLGRLADWPDPVMLEGMREHYPAITLDDRVQVIEHTPPAALHDA